VQAEDAQAGQVGRGGQQAEVGGDLGTAAERAGRTRRGEAGLAVVAVARVGWSAIAAVRPAGQVTVPAPRSIRNWSVVKCPFGATAAWTLTRGSMPAAARLASSGPVP
jgi:hypothetical protein